MYKIEKLKENDYSNLAQIFKNAYPGIPASLEDYENSMKKQHEYEWLNFYGVYDENNLVGGMRLHDFEMNLMGQYIKAGGVGSIAVDLLYKKQKVAYEIMKFYLYHYKNLGASMALLYPFNPEFYRKMGFGFGTSMNQFKVKPSYLKRGSTKKHMKCLSVEDAKELHDFYNMQVNKNNGLIKKELREFQNRLKNKTNKIYGYKKDGKIEGYIAIAFKKSSEETFLTNDIFVSEILFDNLDAFNEIMTFLHDQKDQIRYVIINTFDEDFRYTLNDPRNDSNKRLVSVYHECSYQGTGIMYRVLDVNKLLEDLKNHNFSNESCNLKLKINDSFMEENEGYYFLEFKDGSLKCSNDEIEYDVELEVNIDDFSSLITCSVDLKSLYRYGLIKLSDEVYLDKLNRIFKSDEKPKCLTSF